MCRGSNPHNAVVRLTAALLFIAVPIMVTAQAAVREAGASPSASAPPVVVNAQPSLSSTVLNQLQNLQQEIMQLRGLVEEQSFEIKRLKQQRLDDYLDLDKRLVELSKRPQVVQQAPTPSILPVAPVENGPSESSIYNEAINRLLDEQDFAGAQSGFERYLSEFPEGQFVANVYYWQGQIYLTEGKTEDAQQSFASIIDEYPEHQKAPDAKFKLAKIYFDQDRKVDAKTLMEEVASSESDASQLAKAFLSNNF